MTLGPIVPTGQLWVVRDVTFYTNADFTSQYHGEILLEEFNGGTILWGVGFLDAAPGRVFHQELRQAVGAGNQLQIRATFTGWTFTVTGYVFTVA